MEYRGIQLDESVKLYNKDGSFNKQIKNVLDLLANNLKEKNHALLSVYKNKTTKVLIDFKCGHEPHLISPDNYKSGQGCPRCGDIKTAKAKKTKAKIEFEKIVQSNGHSLLSPYIKNREKVLIDFNCGHESSLIRPNDYKQGNRCGECRYKKIAETRTKPYKEEFIKLVKRRGHTLLSPYINAHELVLIDFNCDHEPKEVVPDAYKRALWDGCAKCANFKINNEYAKRVSEKFKELVNKNGHALLSDYQRDGKKVLVDFNCGHEPNWITPQNYKQGNRCPICFQSKGVRAISEWLDKNKIEYCLEYKLPNRNWRYDIFVPSENLIIEVHGIQHFKFIKHFHRTKENFIKILKNDHEKWGYARSLGYEYLEIDYREHKPELALERFLKAFNEIRRNETQQIEQLALF